MGRKISKDPVVPYGIALPTSFKTLLELHIAEHHGSRRSEWCLQALRSAFEREKDVLSKRNNRPTPANFPTTSTGYVGLSPEQAAKDSGMTLAEAAIRERLSILEVRKQRATDSGIPFGQQSLYDATVLELQNELSQPSPAPSAAPRPHPDTTGRPAPDEALDEALDDDQEEGAPEEFFSKLDTELNEKPVWERK